MSTAPLIDAYLGGPAQLRAAVAGMTAEQLTATPVPGKWSTKQVICHIADFEPVYADRMKRVIAEDQPPLRGGDPDVFAAKLAYGARDVEEELQLIDSARRHTARVLRTLPEEDFERTGIHSTDGPLTLRALLERITNHIPHHVKFIVEKRAALGLPETFGGAPGVFCLNVVLTVKNEADVPTVARLLAECGRLSRTEKGCLRYEACHSQSDPRLFMLCERWASEQAWKDHRNERAYLEIYNPQVIPLVERVPHISTLL
jgi:quinol monooxygenase YgiN